MCKHLLKDKTSLLRSSVKFVTSITVSYCASLIQQQLYQFTKFASTLIISNSSVLFIKHFNKAQRNNCSNELLYRVLSAINNEWSLTTIKSYRTLYEIDLHLVLNF